MRGAYRHMSICNMHGNSQCLMPAEKRDRKVSQDGRERMSLHAMLPDKTRVHAAKTMLRGMQQMLNLNVLPIRNSAHPCGHACGGSAFGIGNVIYWLTSR